MTRKGQKTDLKAQQKRTRKEQTQVQKIGAAARYNKQVNI